MTLRQLANRCGVRIVRRLTGWGGPIGYVTADSPQITICGFKTATEARQHWLADTFGEKVGAAVMELLNKDKP